MSKTQSHAFTRPSSNYSILFPRFKKKKEKSWYHLHYLRSLIFVPKSSTTRRLLGLANSDCPISHTEVGRNGPLTTNATGSTSLGAGQALENTDLKHTDNLVDLASQRTNRPHTILAITILASLEIGLDQQRLEGSIDNEEALIGLEGTFLGARGSPDGGVDTAEFLQLEDNAVGGDRGDLNRD